MGARSIAVKKVGTKSNPADMLTKDLKREFLMDHTKNVGGHTTDVRVRSALSICAIKLGDLWETRNGRLWIRRRDTWRVCLFTPMKVAGGLKTAKELQGYRCTVGRYKSGRKFAILDDWVCPSEPHRRFQ